MRYEKVYVGIKARFLSEGGMRPTELIWRDGRKYSIDKVKFIERAPARSGGVLVKRYTVVMDGLEKYLFYDKENERWFVEKKVL